jgi:hypothetical protein
MTEISNETILSISNDLKEIKSKLDNLNRTIVGKFREDWIDAQDVLSLLHTSKRNLQYLRQEQKLPYSRIKGKIYYKVEDIYTLLNQNYTGNNSSLPPSK